MGPKKQMKNAEKINYNFKEGEIFKDAFKREWHLGSPFAQGGFGMIYYASDSSGCDSFALKVEPKSNGPLFCEINFYMKACKEDTVENFRLKNDLAHLAIPRLIGHGVHMHDNAEYRFLVMQKYGTNLEMKRLTPLGFIYVAMQMIYTLEFIHSHGFVHSDVKASNIVFDYKDGRKIFLIDYGQVSRFMSNGVHSKYVVKTKNSHDGTLPYTSIDAHVGAPPSRRSDLEILAYNLVDWLSNGRLPWKTEQNGNRVLEMKRAFKQNPASFLEKLLPKTYLSNVLRFLELIFSLKYEQAPDYARLRGVLDTLRRIIFNSKEHFDGLIREEDSRGNEKKSKETVCEKDDDGKKDAAVNADENNDRKSGYMKLRKRTKAQTDNQIILGKFYYCKRRKNAKPKNASSQT